MMIQILQDFLGVISSFIPVIVTVSSIVVAFHSYFTSDSYSREYYSSSIEKVAYSLFSSIFKILVCIVFLSIIFIMGLDLDNLTLEEFIQKIQTDTRYSSEIFSGFILLFIEFTFIIFLISFIAKRFKTYAFNTPRAPFYIDSNQLNSKQFPKDTKIYLIQLINKRQEWLCYYINKDEEVIRLTIPYNTIQDLEKVANKDNPIKEVNDSFQSFSKKQKKVAAIIWVVVSIGFSFLSFLQEGLATAIFMLGAFFLIPILMFAPTIFNFIKNNKK